MINIVSGVLWITVAFTTDPPTPFLGLIPWLYVNVFFLIGGFGLFYLGLKEIEGYKE